MILFLFVEHREHGNRMMHEFLLGQENILREMAREKTSGLVRERD
jgi:hypothetical protein